MQERTNQKRSQSIYHAKANVNFMEESVIQINDGIRINVNVSIKNISYVKKNIVGILLRVVAKMENNYQVLWMIQ